LIQPRCSRKSPVVCHGQSATSPRCGYVEPVNRKTAPKVKRGRVQKKNNWVETSDDAYRYAEAGSPVIDERRPGPKYRHLLTRRDIETFIGILPEWDELSRGLKAIVLAPGEEGAMGWYERGVVAVCAWSRAVWTEWKGLEDPFDPEWLEEHREVMERLGVAVEKEDGRVVVWWTERQARAFQLLHILMHELGHHHDHITPTRSRKYGTRGESFAEQYARRYEAQIWEDYKRHFSL